MTTPWYMKMESSKQLTSEDILFLHKWTEEEFSDFIINYYPNFINTGFLTIKEAVDFARYCWEDKHD